MNGVAEDKAAQGCDAGQSENRLTTGEQAPGLHQVRIGRALYHRPRLFDVLVEGFQGFLPGAGRPGFEFRASGGRQVERILLNRRNDPTGNFGVEASD
jgi:hypothetical protein